MAVTTRLKQLINRFLNPVGLKIDSLTRERVEQEGLRRLEQSGYFRRPAFPVPVCLQESDWRSLVPAFDKYRVELNRLQRAADNDVEFTNENPFYHPPDSDVLYVMVREHRPSRIIEIGSGNSTRLSRQAIIDGKLSTKLISIDPNPRTDISGIADETRIQRVEETPVDELVNELEAGDFLFIDSSHLVRVGNDCTYEFLQLLPRLTPGVVVHVHDISLPWDYPIEWIRRESIVAEWGEQYLLQAILQSGIEYQVLWPGYYVQNCVASSEFDRWFPNRASRDARSLWFLNRSRANTRVGLN